MTAVLGSQWGAEGKGKLVDVLSAGHTIVVPVRPEGVLKTFAFHLLPSGVYMNLYYKTDVGLTCFVSIRVYRPVQSRMRGSDWVWRRCSFAISLY